MKKAKLIDDSLLGKTLSVLENNTVLVSDISRETFPYESEAAITSSNFTGNISITKSNTGGRSKEGINGGSKGC